LKKALLGAEHFANISRKSDYLFENCYDGKKQSGGLFFGVTATMRQHCEDVRS
jgi:hypothetical protein